MPSIHAVNEWAGLILKAWSGLTFTAWVTATSAVKTAMDGHNPQRSVKGKATGTRLSRSNLPWGFQANFIRSNRARRDP